MRRVLLTIFCFRLLLTSANAQEREQTYQCPPGVICDPRKFDEYSSILWGDEKARLNNVAIQLQRERADLVIYLVAYGGRRACVGEARARALRAKNYLVGKRGIPSGRVVSIDGGYRDEQMVEIWVLPRGFGEPYPAPTVDKSEVKLRDCKPKHKVRRKRGGS
jgi:hypothetical protein